MSESAAGQQVADERRALDSAWNAARSRWADPHFDELEARTMLPLDRVLRDLERCLDNADREIRAALSRL